MANLKSFMIFLFMQYCYAVCILPTGVTTMTVICFFEEIKREHKI